MSTLNRNSEIAASGDCGENVTWALYNSGLLTISGSRPMEDYTINIVSPWRDLGIQIYQVVIEPGVTAIGDYAFSNCSRMKEIIVDEDNPNYSSDAQGALFDKEKRTLITVPGATSGTYTIPDSVSFISKAAFTNCVNLAGVTIPASVTAIGDSAFASCSGPTTVTLGSGITSIGQRCFNNCQTLTSVTIPDSVAAITSLAFNNCSNLTGVASPNGVTTINEWTFRCCSSLTSVTLPDSIISVGYGAFKDCFSITDVYYSGTEEQ